MTPERIQELWDALAWIAGEADTDEQPTPEQMRAKLDRIYERASDEADRLGRELADDA